MSLFRRKQQTPEEQAFEQALGEMFDRGNDRPDDEPVDPDREAAAEPPAADDGIARLDFGALQVPAVDGMQVRADLDGEVVVAISVMLDDTVLQIQPFAAPRAEGMWDDVRQEIAEGIRGSEGRARETDGRFGRELQAEVATVDESGAGGRQPARFLGIDGDRWFLRGVVTGAGATDSARAAAVEQVFADVRVVRGSHAVAPGDLLPLGMPEDARLSAEPPQGR